MQDIFELKTSLGVFDTFLMGIKPEKLSDDLISNLTLSGATKMLNNYLLFNFVLSKPTLRKFSLENNNNNSNKIYVIKVLIN